MAVAQGFQAARRLQSPFAPSDFARDVAPLAALYVIIAAAIQQLRRARPNAALPVARFINLFLVSLVTGNGVGGERFVHAPLSGLPPDRYLEAEKAITRSYLPMLAVMPASIVSGLQVLALMPKRRGAAFWLTLAGTAGMIGTFATTLLELPLNRQTLTASTTLQMSGCAIVAGGCNSTTCGRSWSLLPGLACAWARSKTGSAESRR